MNRHSRKPWLAGLAAAVGAGVALLAISGSATAKVTSGSPGLAPNARAAAVGGGGGALLTPPLATPLVDPVLYDQTDNGYADSYVSSSTLLVNALADDFVVPSATNWEITQVSTAGADLADLASVTVTIYADSSDSPGSQVYTITVPSGSFTDAPDPYWTTYGYPGGDLTIPIDATLGPGHYWLSVVGNGGSYVYYWEIRSVVSNDAAMTNGLCGNTWVDMATCFGISGDPNPADLVFSLSGTSTPIKLPQVDWVNASPAAGVTGTHITLSSKAEDPNGLTDIYYNLFTPGGTFVCNLAHVSIAGDPTTYTDSGTVVADPLPFSGLDTGVGGPCPNGGISKGQYVIAANWVDAIGNQEGAPNNQVLANYPASAQFSPFYYANALSPSTYCNGLYTGTATNVVVPKGATCTLAPGTTVTHDVKVMKGGTLITDRATIDHDLTVDGTGTICGSDIVHDLTADGPVTIGGPSCAGNTIGVDLTVQNVKGGATIENNAIGRNLNVVNNTGGETVTGNTVGLNMTVQHNGSPTLVTDNTVGHNAICKNNLGQTASGNIAGGTNTCPAPF